MRSGQASNPAYQVKGFDVVKQGQHLGLGQVPQGAVLVVGNLVRWQRTGRAVPDLPGFHFAAFGDVTADLLNCLAPDLILSALMGDDYDVVDLARKLEGLGFEGQYRALTNGLPNPLLVLTEVRMAAPSLDFDLLDVQGEVLRKR